MGRRAELQRWAKRQYGVEGGGSSSRTDGRDTLGASDPSLRPDHTAQGSSTGKIDPHYHWL